MPSVQHREKILLVRASSKELVQFEPSDTAVILHEFMFLRRGAPDICLGLDPARRPDLHDRCLRAFGA